jgi:hypothetical protein
MFSFRLTEPDTGTTAVSIDELDTGVLERTSNNV